MQVATTWEAVRNKYSVAMQMAVQTVEAYREIGVMLIVLKKNTKHGEFGLKCAEVFGKSEAAPQISNAELIAANTRASQYLRLAEHWDTIKIDNPQSLSEAIKMIQNKVSTTKPASTKSVAVKPAPVKGKVTRLQKAGLIDASTGSKMRNEVYAEVAKRAGLEAIPTVQQMTHEESVLIDQAINRIAEERGKRHEDIDAEVQTLSETAKQKLDRIIEKTKANLQIDFNEAVMKYEESFMERVYEEYKKVNHEWIEQSQKIAAKHTASITEYSVAINGITPHVSEEDYRFLLNCLHPDRAPDDRKDKFAKAFNIVKRLDQYIKITKK